MRRCASTPCTIRHPGYPCSSPQRSGRRPRRAAIGAANYAASSKTVSAHGHNCCARRAPSNVVHTPVERPGMGVPITAQIKRPAVIVASLRDKNNGVFAPGIEPGSLAAETPACGAGQQRRQQHHDGQQVLGIGHSDTHGCSPCVGQYMHLRMFFSIQRWQGQAADKRKTMEGQQSM